ncbi:MAG: hypothetical protein KZQ83_08800 [gamma proteobacterium symbiont of Taylorina sp.]|nr:hypothetical protein [gamma proteobacterium symbiont of Taylorina sp.]
MQHWTSKYTSYGRKQAAGVTGLDVQTISKVSKSLLQLKWLVVTQGYNHLESKTRAYELTWMSYNGKVPTDLWKGNIKPKPARKNKKKVGEKHTY